MCDIAADPIFKLLEAHRDALRTFDASSEREDPRGYERAYKIESELFADLARACPISPVGLRTWLLYVRKYAPERGREC
jgi:hypothetical protein